MRRQSKVQESVEYFTTLRSQRAVERADVALVVCNAEDGVTSQDLRIAELAMQEHCATALVLNKWDEHPLSEDDLIHERARAGRRLRLRPKVLTASALTGRNVTRILQEAIVLGDRMVGRIPTPELNRFLSECGQARQPPAKQGHRLKLLYMAQIGERPPRFAIQVNSRSRVTRDYAYFIENRLRARYGLDGVPVIIDFNERGSGRRAPGGDHRADRLKAVQEDTFLETADVGFDVELEDEVAVDPYAEFEDAPDFDGEEIVDDDEGDDDLLGEADLQDAAEDDQD